MQILHRLRADFGLLFLYKHCIILFFDIEETDNCQSRLRFDEIRMIDKMRVVTKDKPYRDVKTDRKVIEEKFMNFLKLSIFPIDKEEK